MFIDNESLRRVGKLWKIKIKHLKWIIIITIIINQNIVF